MQNFGKIKNVFNNLLIEGIVKKDDNTKKLFKKYIKIIKESEILKTQFLVYNNIESRVDADIMSVNFFISENIKLLKKYKKADILKENQKLVELLKASSFEEDYDLSNLHESLSTLIFTNRSINNISKITDEIKNVRNYITTNKSKQVNEGIDLPVSILGKLMVEKYNQKYDTLDEGDKNVLKILISKDFEIKKKFYSKTVNECLKLTNELLKETDEESKDKLLKVKERLEEKQDITEDDFLNRISKLVELKNSLINN